MSRRHSAIVIFLLVASIAIPAAANHAWGNYHWARTSNPFTLKTHDNLDSFWEQYLSLADADWDRSSVLDVNVIWQSPLSSQRRCASSTGRIEVCNETYGNNGWLGIAGISVSGSHITKAYTKVNDTYFNTATYNTPAWRQFVMCQEIGHDFGLDHQDETFENANLGSCMDYTNDPDGGSGGASSSDPDNLNPNQHDYDQLESIYAHLDNTTTVGAIISTMAVGSARVLSAAEILADAGQWGTPIRYNRAGQPIVFMQPIRVNHAGELEYELTHVLWAPIDPFENKEEEDRNRIK